MRLFINQVTETSPEIAEAYTIRAYSYLGIGERDFAIIDFQRAAELSS